MIKKTLFVTFIGLFILILASSMVIGAEHSTEPIKVGHLTFHTGQFGHVGPQFDGAVNFTLDIINENPPLGREVEAIHQDTGSSGESQAARKLLESEEVDILLNISHEYMSHRDWTLDFIQEQDGERPLLPSVHGGSVNEEYGGNASEPIFRGAPMDTDQGLASALQASQEGAETVVVMASETDGMQQQQDAAAAAAEALGMEVLEKVDFQPEQSSYRSLIARVQALNPDALLVFSAGEDGGIVVKNAAEMGMSSIIVGPTDWLFVEFPETATMSALQKHKSVTAVGFTYAEGPAWDYYKEAWESSEYADLTQASNSYTMQFYDLLNVTMLAIEKAGSTEIAPWVDAMFEVTMEPGKKVYTYEEGIEALRNGEDIDYEGVTGSYNYTDTGVVGGLFGVFEWKDLENLERVKVIEGSKILDISDQMSK